MGLPNVTSVPDSISVAYVSGDLTAAKQLRERLESYDDSIIVTPLTDIERLLGNEIGQYDCVIITDQLPDSDPIAVAESVDSTPVVLHVDQWESRFARIDGTVDAIVREGDGTIPVLCRRIRTHVNKDQTDEAFEHLEHEYSLASEVASDLFWSYDITTGEFVVDGNIREFGFDPEAVGDELDWWMERIHPDDRDRIRETYERIFEGDTSVFDEVDDQSGQVTTEFTLETDDGSEIVCLVRTLCLFDEEQNPSQLIGAGTDVTNQREVQDWFESLVQFSSNVITVVDEDGKLVYNSPSVERVLGFSQDELRDEFAFEYIHPDDRERVQEKFMEMVTEEDDVVSTVETRIERADGSYVWVESRGTNRTTPELDGYVINYIDITERKQYEQELERVKRRYDAIFDDTETFFVLLDTDGSVLDINDATLSLVETDREAMLGESIPETVMFQSAKMDRDEYRSYLERVSAGETARVEIEMHPDSETTFIDLILRPVTQDGTVESIVAIGRDITRIKRRERALDTLLGATQDLQAARERDTVVGQAVSALAEFTDEKLASGWLYDDEDDILRPVAATPEARAEFGGVPTLCGGESIAWEVFSSQTPRMYDDVSTHPDRYAAETEARSELLLPLSDEGVLAVGSTQTGAFEEMDFALAQLLAASTEAALDRAQREQTLRKQRAQLKQQNEKLEQVASILSHDLRNPLNVATLRTELALEETDNENLEDVEMALDRMGQLIEDVLRLARGGQSVTDPETVCLDDIAAECWSVVTTASATLTVEDAVTFRADRSKFRHVLENLFGNAIDHAGPDVAVTIGQLDGGFYVADDGQGIAPDAREDVFEAGYTSSDDGTGFGLTIVETIATAHGWDVTVTECESGGARFEFRNVELVE